MTDVPAALRTRLDEWADYDGAAGYRRQGGGETGIDPNAAFRELRAPGGDILPTDLHRHLGLDPIVSTTIAQGGWIGSDPGTVFSAVSFEAVSKVLRSPLFDSSAHGRAYEPVLGRTLISLDGDEHRVTRSLASRPFVRRALESWNETVVRPAAARGVTRVRDRLAASGRSDLMADFVLRYPAEVIVQILGLDADDVDTFTNIALAMITFSDPPTAMKAGRLIHDWVLHLARGEREREPRDSLLSLLVRSEEGGSRLSDDEISSLVRLLFVGGFETTLKQLGNVLVGLFAAGQWDDLGRDAGLIPAAVEEGLRWESAVLGIPRVAREDVELFGVRIPRGGVVLCFLSSANRDDRRWPEPDRFDLHRERWPHVTFGLGAHACLGMQLARSELVIALETMLAALPPLAADGAIVPSQSIQGLASRGPDRVAVRAAG